MNLIAWLLCPRYPERGREILGDVLELYHERRATLGWTRAAARAAWDLITLILRPARHPGLIHPDSRRPAMARVVHDLRHALRATLRRPAVSATVLATLTLGIALAVLTFTLVDAILLRPLAFPRSEGLVTIFMEFRPESGYTFARFSLSAPEILDYQQQSRTVDAAAWTPESVALAQNDGVSEPLVAVRASSRVFALLETPPLYGRTLTEADDRPGAPCVAVLSAGLWTDNFAGARNVIGRKVTFSGNPCEIVGVMPPQFAFPSERVRLWLPLAIDPDPNTRGNHGLSGVGRLRPGQTLASARAEAATLMESWVRLHAHHRGHGVVLTPLKEDVVGGVAQQLAVLASAVGFVLVVIAANVASLLLAHGEARRKELAVRSALGAARGSLVRQLVAEGVLVSLLSGAAGIVLAWNSLDALLAFYPQPLPRANEIAITPRVLAATGLASVGIGVLVGLFPAIRLTRMNLSDALQAGARGEGLALHVNAQRWLVATELALAVAVTSGALLLARSFTNLQRVPLGFNPSEVTIALVSLPDVDTRPLEEAPQFFAALTERIRALPGVAAAGAISNVPLIGAPPPDDFTIDGRPVAPPSEPGFNAHYVQVTPGAFEALGVRVLRGRNVGAGDVASAPAVAVINETCARTFWPNLDPIGRRLRYPTGVKDGQWAGWGPWLTIVGIVEDIRSVSPALPPSPAIYVSHAQLPRAAAYRGRTMNIVARQTTAAADTASAIRSIAASLNGDVSVSRVRTMESVVGGAFARPRFMGWLMTLFAAVALIVAALGVYGVVAYTVQRRTREIGVRMALGATRNGIVKLIARQMLVMTGAGLVLGVAAASWLSQSMTALLFGVGSFDRSTYATVLVVFVLTVFAATMIPIRRAMSVDPLIALRAE